MSLEIGAVVWAKVQNEPWWPAQIVHHHPHHLTIIYKVAFLNHPSYAHLHPHQLQPYRSQSPSPSNQHTHSITHALSKAISMANLLTTSASPHTPAPSPALPTVHAPVAEEDICEDNVIEAIQRYRASRADRVGQAYCYHSRKQDVAYSHRLKETLLKKYRLSTPIPNPFQNITATTPRPTLPKPKRIRKTHPKPVPSTRNHQQTRKKCLRKILTLLKSSPTTSPQLRKTALQLMRKVEMVAEDSDRKIYGLGVGLLRLLGGEGGEYRGWLQRVESQKNEDEEGSKMTQYSLPQCNS